MEENEPGRRKRIANACQMCQKRKIRCDGSMPSCRNCTAHSTHCIFTKTQKKRLSKKDNSYIEELENRLKRVESLINHSGSFTKEKPSPAGASPAVLDSPMAEICEYAVQNTVAASANSPRASNQEQDLNTPGEAITEPQIPDATNCNMLSSRSMSIIHNAGQNEELMCQDADSHSSGNVIRTQQRYGEPPDNPCIGSSARFSMFSPEAIQWVTEKIGSTTFKDTIYAASVDETELGYWKSDPFRQIFSRPVFIQLPPQAEAQVLVRKFFKDFNSMCPLFNEAIFMILLERQYCSNPYKSVGWWASLNAVLAIACGLEALEDQPDPVHKNSSDYLQNALAVLTELTIRSTDLFGVQALLAMALFLQGTEDPRPSAFLVASALRLSHTLGLHKKQPANMDPMEAEHRRRVFWVAYRIDKDLCIRSGLPLIQDDDDMSWELPREQPEDGLGLLTLEDGSQINIFRAMAEFALIEARVHRQLYSTKALKKSPEELLATIDSLDHQLEDWKENIPIGFQPDYEIKALPLPLSLHIIVLHFGYHNCLNTIHRMSIQHSYWTSRSNSMLQGLDASLLGPRIFSSAAMCSTAARASLHLIRYIPRKDIGFVWRVLYFPASAFITLFANLLQYPTDFRARSDLRLMGSFLKLLSETEHDDSREIQRVYKVCSEFQNVAREVIEKASHTTVPQFADYRNFSQHVGDKSQATFSSAAPLTPDSASAVAASSAMAFNTGPSMFGSMATQNFTSSLNEPGLSQENHSAQFYPDLMRQLYQNSETVPMFPNGLTMPWNLNTLHGSFLPDSFSNISYHFNVSE